MFFVLSKTLGYLVLPTNLLIAVGFSGVILMATRFASLGRKLVIASVLLLVICGLSPLGKALLYPLEQRFPQWDASRGAPDGIIILGASIEADLSVAHGTPVVRGARRIASSPPRRWRGVIPMRACCFPAAAPI